MDIPIFLSSRGIPFQQLDNFSGPTPPSKAIIREVDFDIRGNELWFYFSGWSADEVLAGPNDIKAVVDRICDPRYVFTNGPIYPDPNKPYGSPLSLRVPDLSYVIYKLSPKSWQFVRRGHPITVGSTSDSKYFCFEGFRCSVTGFDYRDAGIPFNSPGSPRDDCNVLFFIVDGKAAIENEDDQEYDHAINLHVDLVFAGPTVHRMPIMIDPDVRYPGGAGQ